ncbi:MAG: metal ABC transporter ATP-binding protein [Nitrospiria bacterium]
MKSDLTSLNPVLIHFDKATFGYSAAEPALKELSLEVKEGEFIGVIGPNGSGKTTFLRAILGLILPRSGHLHILDCDCKKLQCHHRAKIGYVPQKDNVDPHFPITVFETVLMGRYSSLGLFKRPGERDFEIVMKSLENVSMASFKDTPLGNLSGGQQRRVFIARALTQLPQMLLLDEPTTGIDSPTSHTIIELIRRLHKELHLTIIFVTHEINTISPYIDRLVLLNKNLIAVGKPKEVLVNETLAKVYGKEVMILERERGAYVIMEDHHG